MGQSQSQSQSQSAPTTSSSPESKTKVGKSGKKICCACPDTKKARDECIRDKGEDDTTCQKLIELHKECLRADGFTVK